VAGCKRCIPLASYSSLAFASCLVAALSLTSTLGNLRCFITAISEQRSFKELTMNNAKIFKYNGEWYLRVIPAKTLFRSTMVHEVVNRGDVLAVRMSDSTLTVIRGSSQVEHKEMGWPEACEPDLSVEPLKALLNHGKRH
jgi:hypothetical protein